MDKDLETRTQREGHCYWTSHFCSVPGLSSSPQGLALCVFNRQACCLGYFALISKGFFVSHLQVVSWGKKS